MKTPSSKTKATLSYLAMAMLAVSSANATSSDSEELWKRPSPKTYVSSSSYVKSHGTSYGIAANAEQAVSNPSYDGSLAMSGSFVQTGLDSEVEAIGESHALTNNDDPVEQTDAYGSTHATMQNYHYVPSGTSDTYFSSKAVGDRPFAGAGARDVVTNSDMQASAVVQAGGVGAESDTSLRHYLASQFGNTFLSPYFPAVFATGEDFIGGRRLLTESNSTSSYIPHAYASAHGGSHGSAHGKGAWSIGGNAATSFSNPYGEASYSISIDDVYSGEKEVAAAASSGAETNTKTTGVHTQGDTHFVTEWYVPKGTSQSGLTAYSDSLKPFNVAGGEDVSKNEGARGSAKAIGYAGNGFSQAGQDGNINTVRAFGQPFFVLQPLHG
ncbi:hypothetical protein HOP50_14g72190 [Chloropicon primus]|uniref:Uncharacterized protein n=1 Tax=Chloropicon primus TaxID=1764295 RepID=A0A5B8MWE8_9CHLO|nr:hypothetical protein A3770_14p71990 [Chloropicon primus]QDZ25966.1 hypothetical protein A3770_20p84840 [Chloropicon primus]UPR03889.1 hypothetical protein HOP50_14g72190 [Chloropicon primus]|eukprot:QDZ24681.1 hypothetical protein A3770_14p71990 [Chloropicon primus]